LHAVGSLEFHVDFVRGYELVFWVVLIRLLFSFTSVRRRNFSELCVRAGLCSSSVKTKRCFSVLLPLVLRFLFADGHQFQLHRSLMILPMSISLVSPSFFQLLSTSLLVNISSR
jgi:hypothetical protein